MKKTPTTTDAHCLGCDWTAGPGPAADIDRAAEKHTAKGHPTATITVAALALAVFLAGWAYLVWMGVPS